MNRDKFPRTLNEAFGPYTSQWIVDNERFDVRHLRKILVAVILVICIGGFIILKAVLS